MGKEYTFVGNNPITGRDPTGEIAWFAAVPIVMAFSAAIHVGQEAIVQHYTATKTDYAGYGRAAAGGAVIGAASAIPGVAAARFAGAGWTAGRTAAALYGADAVAGIVAQGGEDWRRGEMSSLGYYAFSAAVGPALRGGLSALGRLRGARPYDPLPDTDLLSRAHNAWRGVAGASADDHLALSLLTDRRLAWTMTSHGVQEFLAGNQGAMRAGFLDYLQHEAGTLRVLTAAQTASLERAAAFSATRSIFDEALPAPQLAVHAADIRHLSHARALGIPFVSFDQTFKRFVTETVRNPGLGAGITAGRDEIIELMLRLGQ